MPRPLRVEFPGAFYHAFNRGVEKRQIFLDEKDFKFFLKLLGIVSNKLSAVIHAYCLMTNHYHLFIETPLGNLSQIMHYVNSLYAQYFNFKYSRVGSLFGGRYKSILVESDNYSLGLSRYIHLNPVKANLVERPENWQWSSYGAYIKEAKREDFLKTEFLMDFFPGNLDQQTSLLKSFTSESQVMTSQSSNEFEEKLILGSRDFLQLILSKHFDELEKAKYLLEYDKENYSIELFDEYIMSLSLDDSVKKNLQLYCMKVILEQDNDQISRTIPGLSSNAIKKRMQRVKRSNDLCPIITSLENIWQSRHL